MKKSTTQSPKHTTKFNQNKHRPDIRDNMDSREGEEQLFKGDDTTHNKKENKSKDQEKQ